MKPVDSAASEYTYKQNSIVALVVVSTKGLRLMSFESLVLQNRGL